jgi:GST-like protein
MPELYAFDPGRRAIALQWLAFAISHCMLATAMIFMNTAIVPEKSPANVEFFSERLARYFSVIEARLAGREWLADELSVADFALLPIVRLRQPLFARHGGLPALAAWLARLEARPGVARAVGD